MARQRCQEMNFGKEEDRQRFSPVKPHWLELETTAGI
jgi:hypothetical protein